MTVTEVLEFAPTVPVEGAKPVEFRLVYEGILSGASGDKTEKHAIRKVFGEQLRELWRVHPALVGWPNRVASKDGRTWLDLTMEEHGGFVPLVSEEFALTCDLDVLFLRRDAPGRILSSGGGDVDRRLVTLFDALRKPTFGEVAPLGENEKPFYVLLQDDSLITKVAVTTDRLLTSPEVAAHINHVHLVLTVRLNVGLVTIGNVGFLG